jgi:ribosome maturation factor RimP
LIANHATNRTALASRVARPASKAPPRCVGGPRQRTGAPERAGRGAPGSAQVAGGAAGGDWIAAVGRTVEGLGYDLVDVEREGRGLLRVTIDRVPGRTYTGGDGEFVTVDDCEAVTRQLQYVLEVEGCDYARLEVSSPGLDRPLKRARDYERFAGAEVDLTLREPFQGRRKYRGTLAHGDGGHWRLALPGGEQALDFALDEVREVRLVPVVDFKGRKGRGAQVPAPGAEEVDGGRRE